MLTSEQVRAARALLRLDQAALAKRAGVSVETIKRLERLDGALLSATGSTLQAIRGAFEDLGIEFIDHGVRIRKSQ